jgi:hypothetical protein
VDDLDYDIFATDYPPRSPRCGSTFAVGRMHEGHDNSHPAVTRSSRCAGLSEGNARFHSIRCCGE